MSEKKDPYAVEKKPPIISHIVGRSIRNRAAFGARPVHGSPIAGRSRKCRGVEPLSPVKPEHHGPSSKQCMSAESVAALAKKEPKVEATSRLDRDTLPNEVVIRFEGDPRKHEYEVFVDKTGEKIGSVCRTVCDAETFKTVWKARNGEWCEQFASRLVAAYKLWQRSQKS